MTHSFTINQDVEETRRLEAEMRNIKNEGRIEDFCLQLFLEATDGDASKMLAMLDMFAAKMIYLVSKNPKNTVEMHALHVTTIIENIRNMKGERR